MKRNRIFLDFTSLLDIMMIILFFFILNFNNAQADYNNKVEQIKVEKQDFEIEKEEWQKQADAELEKIRETDEKAADNAQALIDFKNGHFINICMDVKVDINEMVSWEITVSRGNTPIGTISSAGNPDITDEFVTILNKERFKKDDVIIAVFQYDIQSEGSHYARNVVFKKLKEAEQNFTNLYLAEAAYGK